MAGAGSIHAAGRREASRRWIIEIRAGRRLIIPASYWGCPSREQDLPILQHCLLGACDGNVSRPRERRRCWVIKLHALQQCVCVSAPCDQSLAIGQQNCRVVVASINKIPHRHEFGSSDGQTCRTSKGIVDRLDGRLTLAHSIEQASRINRCDRSIGRTPGHAACQRCRTAIGIHRQCRVPLHAVERQCKACWHHGDSRNRQYLLS